MARPFSTKMPIGLGQKQPRRHMISMPLNMINAMPQSLQALGKWKKLKDVPFLFKGDGERAAQGQAKIEVTPGRT